MDIHDLILYPTSERIREVPIHQVKTFGDIGIDGSELLIRSVNRSHVRRLADSGSWPAIEVAQIQHNGTFPFLLVDGKHRLEAARILKRQSIEVHTKNYASGEAVAEAAIFSNLRHGLLPQDTKKSDYAIYLYLNGYQDNLKGIAEKTLLSLSVVEHTIEKYLEEEEEEEETVSRIVMIAKYIARYMKMIEKESGNIDKSIQAVDILRYIMSLTPHTKKKQVYDALVAVQATIELVSTMEVVRLTEGVKVPLPEYLSIVLGE